MLLRVCSAAGAPGVTTLCQMMTMAWAARGRLGLLLEFDASGGDVALRQGRPDNGMVAWAGLTRRSHDWDQVIASGISMGERCGVVTGPVEASKAERYAAICAKAWAVLESAPAVCVADLGRTRRGQSPVQPLLEAPVALPILVVLHPTPEQVGHARDLTEWFRELRQPCGAVLVAEHGRQAADPREISYLLGVEVIGALPYDHHRAELIGSGDITVEQVRTRAKGRSGPWNRSFADSKLWGSVNQIVDRIEKGAGRRG